MTTRLDTRIRRPLGVLVAAVVIVLVAAASALAGGRPAASYYTKQQLESMSQSWAARAAVSSPSPEGNALLRAIVRANAGSDAVGGRPAASYYTKQQLESMSQSWALRSMAPSDRQALLQSVQTPPVASSGSGGLDWGDFGIGAAGMFGLVLLVGGGFLAVHFGRRPSGVGAPQT